MGYEKNCVCGQHLCKPLPFVDGIIGCGTASRLFGVGKRQGVKTAVQLRLAFLRVVYHQKKTSDASLRGFCCSV